MEEGHLTDARGRQVDFRNAIIIMTSNLGAEKIRRGTGLGFEVDRDENVESERAYEDMKKSIMGELRRNFRPEFLNRLDDVIVFRALTKSEIAHIVDLRLNDVRERMIMHSLNLQVTEAACLYLGEAGFDPEYGARPLRRVITNMIEDRLSDGILSGEFANCESVLVDYDVEQKTLIFKPIRKESQPVLAENPAPLS
jgi:ATP-dependent Clp protease ATP-binding subunit ClpC